MQSKMYEVIEILKSSKSAVETLVTKFTFLHHVNLLRMVLILDLSLTKFKNSYLREHNDFHT